MHVKRIVNILFTSVGRRVELVRAFRRAYDSLGLSGSIAATDIDALAPALHVVDRPYIVPRLTLPDYVPTLAEICRREEIDLVFPLIDPDILVLARSRDVIEASGARLVAVSTKSAAIAADKWATYQLFRQLGLPTPDTWLPGALDLVRTTYPLFIKPRFGSAGKNSFKVHNERELAFFVDYVPDPVIQTYLPGPEITNDVICDLDGEPLAVVSRQRIEVRWGEVAKGVTIYSPAITSACIRIAQALQAIGPITVQCLMKGDVPCFTEINARWGGGAPLGFAAGADSPRWLLANTAGVPTEARTLGSYQVGLYLTRCDDSFFVPEVQYEQMASRHL